MNTTMPATMPRALAPNSSAIAGLICHAVVTLPMLAAGIGKTFRLAPRHVLEMFATQYHLDQQMQLIGVGELLCIALLLIPRTLPFGILMISSYWGGAIMVHMCHDQSYLLPSVLLILSWAGYVLRLDPDARRALLARRTLEGQSGR
jgi:hypothetical protein